MSVYLTVIMFIIPEQINNAGCMVNQRELTEDGLEKNFATNTLGNNFFFLMYSYHNHYTLNQVTCVTGKITQHSLFLY